jgi:hypothetical protein
MEGMSTPAFTEQAIKNFAIKWSIEYFEVARADQRYIRVDHFSKISEKGPGSLDEWELRVWYTEDDYAYVYVKVGNNKELEVTQVDY